MSYDNSFTAVTGATYTAAQYNTYVRDNLDALFAKIEGLYPIGKIVHLYTSTNPATLFGFGTWALLGPGMATVCIDTSDADFDTLGKEYGEKAHALTSAENGPHTHTYSRYNGTQNVDGGAATAAYYVPSSGTTGSSGSGDPHNTVQPSIVVYRWRRTA